MQLAVLFAVLTGASGLQLGVVSRAAATKPRVPQAPQLALPKAPGAGAALATSLALLLATANPAQTHAVVEPPAVVRQYGSSMVAEATDAELRDAQKKFLEERAKIKQTYDDDVESNFVDASQLSDKKSIYVTIVGGLIVVAFVAPMLQFFYYTGGD